MKIHPFASNALLSQTYMDDILVSCTELVTLLNETKHLHNSTSNSISLLKQSVLMFDPLGLGLIAIVIVVGKMLMQELCPQKIDLDTLLDPETSNKWTHFFQDILYLRNVKIPRHLFFEMHIINLQLYGFADANLRAMVLVFSLTQFTRTVQFHEHW